MVNFFQDGIKITAAKYLTFSMLLGLRCADLRNGDRGKLLSDRRVGAARGVPLEKGLVLWTAGNKKRGCIPWKSLGIQPLL